MHLHTSLSNLHYFFIFVFFDTSLSSILLHRQSSIIIIGQYLNQYTTLTRPKRFSPNRPLEYVRLRQPSLGIPVFVSECLKYPGFIEFDDSNSKVLTYSAVQTQYKVWDLKNYSLMFGITDPAVTEIKMSPGVMLLIYKREYRNVPLKMLAIKDGKLLHDISCPVVPRKPVEFVEQSNGKILMKQLNTNLSIYDVKTKTIMIIEDFSAPSAFIFLYINRLFLTFRGTRVSAWNFQGTQATKFVDHELWSPEASTNNNFISEDQHLLISYCKNKALGRSKGSLNISHCVTGELIHKLDAPKNSFYRSALETVASEENSELEMEGSSSSSSTAPGASIELVPMGEHANTNETSASSSGSGSDNGNGNGNVNGNGIDTASEEDLILTDRPRLETMNSPPRSSSSSIAPFSKEDKKRIAALDGVTAIFFNEDHSEIYTGNRKGQIWVWGH